MRKAKKLEKRRVFLNVRVELFMKRRNKYWKYFSYLRLKKRWKKFFFLFWTVAQQQNFIIITLNKNQFKFHGLLSIKKTFFFIQFKFLNRIKIILCKLIEIFLWKRMFKLNSKLWRVVDTKEAKKFLFVFLHHHFMIMNGNLRMNEIF